MRGAITPVQAVCMAAMAMAVTGCSSTGVSDLSSYKPVPIPKADHIPSKEQMRLGKSKVVVYEVQSATPGAKEYGLDAAMTSALEGKVAKAAELVDRSAARALRREVETAERSGDASYSGPDVADYAVKAQISQANFGSSFQEARTTEDDDQIPAKCSYEAEVVGVMKIYTVPDLDVAKTIGLEGDAYSSTETRSSECNAAGQGLLRTAAEEAISSRRTAFQNFFAPRGYVVKRRKKEDDNLFKTTLGTDLAAKKGRSVQVIRVQENRNELTGAMEIHKRQLAEGVITEELGANYSWIRVSEPKKADKLKMGDRVKPVFEKGWLGFGG